MHCVIHLLIATLLERIDKPPEQPTDHPHRHDTGTITPARTNHPQAKPIDNTGQKQTRSLLDNPGTPDTPSVSHRTKVTRVCDPRSATTITFPDNPDLPPPGRPTYLVMSSTLIHGEAYNSTQNGSIVSVNLCVTSAISDNVPTVDIDYEQNTEGQPDTTHTVRPAQTSTKNDTETQPLAQRTATSRTHKADKDVRTFGQRKRQLKDKIIPTRQLKTWKDSATSGIPSHPEALISIVWQEHKGASIIAKDTLYPGDVATRYDTNHEWTKEEFNHRYPQPWNTLTSERRQELDYALFNRHMQKFVIGTPTPYDNPRGVGQFINCATPQTNERNNCKFICNKGGTYITVTKTNSTGPRTTHGVQ